MGYSVHVLTLISRPFMYEMLPISISS
jgi:hypothetical protein